MDNRNNYKQGRRPIKREGDATREVAEGIIYGRNQVRELLKTDRAVKVYSLILKIATLTGFSLKV